MILYLDGLGRTGKTTLAERLCADLPGYERVHFSVPVQADVFGYFWKRLERMFAKGQKNLVIDRFHWSNYAYGDIFGGGVLVDFDHWRLDRYLAERKAVAILLVDDPRSIYRRMQETAAQDPDKRVLTSIQQIGEVQNRFNLCFDRSSISPRWSLGLDQLFDLGTESRQPLTPYEALLAYVRSEGKETL